MNMKKIAAISLAAVMSLTSMLSASAADKQLTESHPSDNTEVTAQILVTDPGTVSYIITIPDVIDFEVLTRPEDGDDHYKMVDYTVKATQINDLPNDKAVTVYVKDQASDANGDTVFRITNKSNSGISFTYDVFAVPGNEIGGTNVAINSLTMQSVGYLLKQFTATGDQVNGTLRINQNQLYPHAIEDIVGEYSGYMVFTSMITDRT